MPCLNSGFYCYGKHHDQSQLREKCLFQLTAPQQPLTPGRRGRKLGRSWGQALRGCLLACSSWFPSTVNQDNAPRICPQANLRKAFSQLRFLLPDMSRFVSSWQNPTTACHRPTREERNFNCKIIFDFYSSNRQFCFPM